MSQLYPRRTLTQLFEHITGCRSAQIEVVVRCIASQVRGRGRPPKHSLRIQAIATLLKLRLNLTVRAIAALTGMPVATTARAIHRVVRCLADAGLGQPSAQMLIVDTTSVRIGSSELKACSGHKHHRCAKVQVVATANGAIVDVSDSYPGSVHDKRIWDAEASRFALGDVVVLGDKAYAGGHGEGVTLFRPTKRNESAYHSDKHAAKERNRQISRVRVRIEHVFARLKCWRVIAGIFPYHWSNLGIVVKALAVLHNLAREI